MTVCGYHPYMGEGLRRFAEGLFLALQEKANKRGSDMRSHMSREADEIALLRSYLEDRLRRGGNSTEPGQELGFLSIVYLCNFLMGDVVKLAETPDNVEHVINKNADRLVAFLSRFEDAFEESPNKASAVAKTRYAWDVATRHLQDRAEAAGELPSVPRRARA